MKRIALHWQVIIALILGLFFSFLAVKFGWNEFTLHYIDPFGEIFINILKLIAVPLVLFSIISGIINLKDVGKLGKLGVKTLAIYVLTTMTSVSIGLLLVNAWKPGSQANESTRLEKRIEYELWMRESGAQILDDICESCKEENHHQEMSSSQRSRQVGQPRQAPYRGG